MASGNIMLLVTSSLLFWQAITFTSGQSTNHPDFDEVFEDFLHIEGYRGGAVAAMKDGTLLHAQGYGYDRQGRDVKSGSHFPVSSLAKSLTAVSILRMVQTGELKLGDKVFGPFGLLPDIEPFKPDLVPDGLFDITVDHLLRHTAGWNDTRGPLYDPLMNEVYLYRGHDVPNIGKEMDVLSPVMPEDLISYMMSQPLDFSPGTRVAYSNIGYLVLGRVVEISGMEYRDYVKRYILDACGMWSTRLELTPSFEPTTAPYDPEISTIYDVLDPEAIDSTLGWYSNVFDMARFSRCIFQTQTVLDDTHLELLLARPSPAPHQTVQDDVWDCAGFRTNTHGLVWQDADVHADDLILYHDTKPHGKGSPKSNRPDTWMVMLYGRGLNHLRHSTKELMAYLTVDTHYESPPGNLFAWDLCAMHRHPLWLETPKDPFMPEYTVHFKLDEHHLTAYTVALQDEGFTLEWVTSYSAHGHTYFLVVGKKVEEQEPDFGFPEDFSDGALLKRNPVSDSDYDVKKPDFVFQHGLSNRALLKRKLQLEQMGYNMTQLHSYRSRSHADPVSFAAVFRYNAFSRDTQMKYGTSHLPEPYEKLVDMYHEKHFYPVSQTVVYNGEDEKFSFIYIKENRENRIDFRQYYNLTPKRLSRLAVENAKEERRLSYLNSYDINRGKFRFSAVFSNATHVPGLLEIDQPVNRATEIAIYNLGTGLVPRFIVPYLADKTKEVRMVMYFQEDY